MIPARVLDISGVPDMAEVEALPEGVRQEQGYESL